MIVNNLTVDQMLEQVLPELADLLKSAPFYGEIALSISFHDGRIVRTGTTKSIHHLVAKEFSAPTSPNNNKRQVVRVKGGSK